MTLMNSYINEHQIGHSFIKIEKPLELRFYQQRALDMIRRSIATGHRRPLVVMSTGAGKSPTFGEIIYLAGLKDTVCLFLVHRRNLVMQFKETLRKHFGIDAGVVMSGEDFVKGKMVYCATAQTYSRRLKLEEECKNKFFIDADLIFTDEAHRTISPTYRGIFDHYPDKIIIGTTATPILASQRGMGEVYDDLLDVIQTKELTDKGFLAPVTYFVPSEPDLSKVGIVKGDYDEKQLLKIHDKPKIIGDVVESWIDNGGGRKTIVFAVNVKHSKHICESFNKVGIKAVHLDSKSTDEEREEAFRQLEAREILIICNVALYREGTDVPEIGCVVEAFSSKNIAMWRQTAGRGLRLSEEYDNLIVIDHGGLHWEHGPLTDDIEWSLDGKVKAWKKAVKKKTDPKSMKCHSCNLVFEGTGTCPQCGSPIKSFGQDVAIGAGNIVSAKTGKKPKATITEKRIYYGMCLSYAATKKWNSGAAAHKYKSKYKVFPRGLGEVAPITPDSAFLSYQTHLLIKYGKDQAKKKANK